MSTKLRRLQHLSTVTASFFLGLSSQQRTCFAFAAAGRKGRVVRIHQKPALSSFIGAATTAMEESSWEPLPPRGDQSNRERHRKRRQITSSSALNSKIEPTSSVEQQSSDGKKRQEAETSNKPPRRKNRPGFNSYLKVVLDDESLKRLRDITLSIRDRVKKSNDEEAKAAGDQEQPQQQQLRDANSQSSVQVEPSGQQVATSSPNGSMPGEFTTKDNSPDSTRGSVTNKRGSGRDRRKKPLTVKPRSVESLHMTLFFGGETLCELPAEELVDFHKSVTQLLVGQGGFVQEESEAGAAASADQANTETTNSLPSDNSTPLLETSAGFFVKELTLFPPRRNNLIVAIFEPNPLFQDLHDAVRDAAKNGSSEALREITSYSKDKWTPHVTLANIYGGNKADTRHLREMLREITLRDSGDDACMFEATARLITMGGPMPEQAELDWKFTLPS